MLSIKSLLALIDELKNGESFFNSYYIFLERYFPSSIHFDPRNYLGNFSLSLNVKYINVSSFLATIIFHT